MAEITHTKFKILLARGTLGVGAEVAGILAEGNNFKYFVFVGHQAVSAVLQQT